MDFNNFGPLNAETWGTVSDWVMVFVTSLTAYFLWRTLKSQTIVQESQQKITTIETNRYISSIKPKFGFAKDKKVTTHGENRFIFQFQCIDNDAKFVSAECQETNPNVSFLLESGEHAKSFKQEWEFISKGELFYIIVNYSFSSQSRDRTTKFMFRYQDSDGNHYSQNSTFVERQNFPAFSDGYERRILF